jgi:hypothetical protein
MKTPGGHLVSHVDPLKARFGTCLRKPSAGASLVRDESAAIYVEHLEWWMFYPDHVVGKGRRGYFIFNEPGGLLEFYPAEQSLLSQVAARRLGTPTSKRLTPEDGWRDTWLPVYRDACSRRVAAGSPAPGLDQATHQAMKEICASLGFK